MELGAVVVGLVLLVVGAIGATVTQRWLEAERRGRWAPPALVPYGILMGAGAALVRGWDLMVAIVVGGVLAPAVGIGGRLLEVRRRRRLLGRQEDRRAVREDDGPGAADL